MVGVLVGGWCWQALIVWEEESCGKIKRGKSSRNLACSNQ